MLQLKAKVYKDCNDYICMANRFASVIKTHACYNNLYSILRGWIKRAPPRSVLAIQHTFPGHMTNTAHLGESHDQYRTVGESHDRYRTLLT